MFTYTISWKEGHGYWYVRTYANVLLEPCVQFYKCLGDGWIGQTVSLVETKVITGVVPMDVKDGEKTKLLVYVNYGIVVLFLHRLS